PRGRRAGGTRARGLRTTEAQGPRQGPAPRRPAGPPPRGGSPVADWQPATADCHTGRRVPQLKPVWPVRDRGRPVDCYHPPPVRRQAVGYVWAGQLDPPAIRDGPRGDSRSQGPHSDHAPELAGHQSPPVVREHEFGFPEFGLGPREVTNEPAVGRVPDADPILADVLGG